MSAAGREMITAQMTAALEGEGYRIGKRAELAKDTRQPRLSEFAGEWAIDDPNDNEDGFVLVGDDLAALVAEAHEDRIVQWFTHG